MPPTIVAHRGLWVGHGAENSLAAFEAAAAEGFQSECDVWPSADGEPVVIHDQTVDRTTLGSGLVGSFHGDQLASLSVPMLADVADLVHFVEIKPMNAPGLIRRVIETMGSRRWMLQSFDPENLEHARKMKADVSIALLADDVRAVGFGISKGWRIHVNHKLLDARIAATLHESGLQFGVWTVNEEADLRRVLPWRPDVIISDRPAVIRHLLSLE